MKINLKIVLPIYFLLAAIIIAFGYLTYYIDIQSKLVETQNQKFLKLNNLSQELLKEQEITEYNIIVYVLNQDPKSLEVIAQSDKNKEEDIAQILPLMDTQQSENLIQAYIDARKDIDKIRNDLLDSVKTGNRTLINEKYNTWNQRTQQIRETIKDIELYNLKSPTKVARNFESIGNGLTYIIILMIAFVVLAFVIFFFYIKQQIVTPIIKLSKYANEISKKNFSSIGEQKDFKDDEIGKLFKAFVHMSQNLEKYYSTLEQNVEDRTLELIKRTKELEIERKELIATKALDSAILSSVGDALCVIDTAGEITFVNEAFEKITGWKAEEALGGNFTELIPAENEKGLQVKNGERYISRILAGQNPENDFLNTVYYVRKDRTRFPVSSLVKRIVLGGKLVGAVKTFSDVTLLKTIDKAKTEFVSLAAHQLRTPLSAISWYTEMLLSGDAGEISSEHKKYLNRIHEANQRMIAMVKSFLSVSRIEMGTMQLRKEMIDVSELLQSVIEEQKRKLEVKNITLDFDYSQDLPKINIDPDRIRMVFQNLLSNAIKYSPEKETVKVSVSVDNEKRHMLIKFSDNGYGIPQEDKHKIFTKLFRAANVLEMATEGTGLGLYVVKNIVDVSGGEIWFESTEGVGTTFFLALPL